MKKSAIFLSTAVVALFASVSLGQESVIWFDARPNNAGSGINTITGTLPAFNPVNTANPYVVTQINNGRRGAGQIIRLEGKRNSNRHVIISGNNHGNSFPNHDADGDNSTSSAWLYLDMYNDEEDPANTSDVLASLGLDLDIVPVVPGDLRNRIASIDFQLFNDGNVRNSITGGQPLVWDDKVNGAVVPGDPPSWAGAKAVRVPVSAGPMYNAALGITKNNAGYNSTTMPYRVGRLDVVSATRNCTGGGTIGGLPAHTLKSSYDVFLKVNNLLIARVFESGGDNPPSEKISFGFNGSLPETPTVNGSQQGAMSALPDLRIEVRLKGDYNGDGQINSADNPFHSTAVSGNVDTLLQVYCGDFNNSNTTTSADTPFFANARNVGLLLPPNCP